MPTQTSRKFIDLIWSATAKWASWDPGHEVKVGDFGTIDKEYGKFNRRGNIYDDKDKHIYLGDENIIKHVKENPPKPATRDQQFIATSANVRQGDLKLLPHVSIAELAEASIKGEWAFGSKRGALLIMARPCSHYIPHGTLLEHLAKVKALEDMLLVTEVFFCPAYSLYLSSGNNDVISLALVGSAPIPQAPGVTAGAELKVEWRTQNTAGLFRNGCEPRGEDSFTPLYMLKRIREKRWFKRGAPPPMYEGDDLWTDEVEPPWDPLDDEGNEVVFEDTVFD